MLARSKAEALFLIRAYERESAKVGGETDKKPET